MPSISDVVERFREYNKLYPLWGSIHIVMEDGNVRDSDVLFCSGYAKTKMDQEGFELSEILLSMSKTQRLKLRSVATRPNVSPCGY